jgi:glucose-6-phosphate 1-epimerase
VELGLQDSEATRAEWPHAFALRLRVALSAAGALRMDLAVQNTGAEALSFTLALHTYLRVPDVTRASVRGLGGVQYLDSLQSRKRFLEEGDSVRFDKEARRGAGRGQAARLLLC